MVNKVHFFGGFESTYRDLSGATPVTIRPDDAQRLGLPPQPSALPREQTARFYIGKVDWQASASHRVTGRYIYFENDSPNNVGSTTSGVPNSTEVLTNFVDAMKSVAGQVVSTFGGSRLNELRIQYADRHQSSNPCQKAPGRSGAEGISSDRVTRPARRNAGQAVAPS